MLGRHCIFCDAVISGDAPPEHVLPKWLSKFLDRGEYFTHGSGTFQTRRGSPTLPWRERPEYRSKKMGDTVKTVCRDCNHHWMSDLEVQASPVLTPMIEGRPQGLDLDQQVLLGRWATKTAMVWDQLVPTEDRIYVPEEWRWLRTEIVPPPDTTVHLAHYTGTTWAFLDVKHESLFWTLPADAIAGKTADAHRTLLVLGHLVIDVAVRRPIGSLAIMGHESVDDLLLPVWPTAEPRVWPPRLGLNDMALTSLISPSEPN